MMPQLLDYTATMWPRLGKARVLANLNKNYSVVTKSIAREVLNTNLSRLSHAQKRLSSTRVLKLFAESRAFILEAFRLTLFKRIRQI